MKAYTDFEQSKKLAEILPLENADMRYERVCFDRPPKKCWYVKLSPPFKSDDIIPCWSLTALMDVLDRGALFKTPEGWVCQAYVGAEAITSYYYSNPIDACIEIISELHKQKLL